VTRLRRRRGDEEMERNWRSILCPFGDEELEADLDLESSVADVS